jgi:protocatechuate 3,4-dioxygenase beta subunit
MKSRRRFPSIVMMLACVSAGAGLSAAPRQNPRDRQQAVVVGTASLSGRVAVDVDRQLAPVRRARVTLESDALAAPQTTDTDTDGRYRFVNLPAGAYRVNADKPGFVLPAIWSRRAWNVAAGQAATADVVMVRGAALEGRVVNDSGDAVAGVVISASRFVYGSHGARSVAVQQVRTDGHGRFRVHTLPAGDYYLDAAPDLRPAGAGAPMPTGAARTYYPGTPRVSDARRITLGVGEEVLNLDFTMTAVPLANVSVVIADSTGQRAANASARLQRVGSAPGDVVGFRNPQTNSSDFRNVPPGDYWVTATSYSTPNADPEFAATRLTIAGQDVPDFSVNTSKGAAITGRVDVEGASAPLPAGLQLMALETEFDLPTPQGSPTPAAPIMIGADGSMIIRSLFGPRLIRLTRLPANWALKSVWLDDAEITDTAVDFKGTERPRTLRVVVTPNTASISGTVDDARGRRALVARVVVFSEDERQWGADSRVVKTAEISPSGQFTIVGLLSGTYFVAAVESLDDGAWADSSVLRQLKSIASPVTLTEHQVQTIALKLRKRMSMIWMVLALSLITRVGPGVAPAAQDPVAKGTGRIAGTVTAVDTGRAVSGATIRLLRWEGGRGYPSGTKTDAQGHFVLPDLLPGSYQLTVTATGFLAMDYGQRQPPEAGKRIELKDAELFDRADVSLPRPSGVEGRLLDEFGDPAPGVVVQIATVQYAAGARRLIPMNTPPANPTDDKGQFRIDGLSPGEYYIMALSGPFASTSTGAAPNPGDSDRAGFAPTFYPGTAMAADAKPVKVELGRDVLGVSFSLVAAQMATLSGIAVDAGGQPVKGALLMLLPTQSGDVRMISMARFTTGTDGAFSFRNVPWGTYVIQGSAPGGPLVGQGGFGSVQVTAGQHELASLTVRINPPATMRGRLVFEGSAPPSPISDVVIQPRPTNFIDGPIGGGPRRSITRDDLTFEVPGLAGLAVVAIIAPPPWMVKSVTVAGKDMTDTPIDFRSGDVNDVEVVLTSRVGSVTGVVFDEDKPSTDYGVIVFAEDSAKWTFPSRFISAGRPNQQGRFTASGLPPADYLVIALPSIPAANAIDPEFLESLRKSATKFSLSEGEAKTLDLKIVKR